MTRTTGPRIYLVMALTPEGKERRRIYLGVTHAHEKAAQWRRRGWDVELLRGNFLGDVTR